MDFDDDGALEQVCRSDLALAFRAGHVKLYRCAHLKHWNASVAKNIAHCAVIGWQRGDTCVNLDGDNVVTVDFVEHAITASADMAAGRLKAGCVQYGSQDDPGCTGRILTEFSNWHSVRGYDREMPFPSVLVGATY